MRDKESVIKELRNLADLIVKCRDVPQSFFTEFGKKHTQGIGVTAFGDKRFQGIGFEKTYLLTRNPHLKGTICHDNWKKDPNLVLATIMWRVYDHYVINEGCDEEEILYAEYTYERMDCGCVGELITRNTYAHIPYYDGIGFTDYCDYCEILRIGRNENFKSCTQLTDYQKERGGFIDGNLQIIPAIPLDDAKEITKRFKLLLEEYNNH